ncbi:MAG: VOC family protein [Defluviitaleaceae bacterium]|nr:VOC family protein [Defluviitaleaceae bacterium]
MTFDVFLNFDGDCREALNFYAEVFGLEVPAQIMTYDQAPDGEDMGIGNEGRILYATLPIFGSNVMFSDCPAGGDSYVKGTNIALTLGTSDEVELTKVFNALAKDGEIQMPLEKTFFSELYGMVTDKFQMTWQLSKTRI